jgi:hypothetical protein
VSSFCVSFPPGQGSVPVGRFDWTLDDGVYGLPDPNRTFLYIDERIRVSAFGDSLGVTSSGPFSTEQYPVGRWVSDVSVLDAP